MQMERMDEPPSRAVTVAVLGLASMTIMANATVASSLPGLREHYADVPYIDTLAGLIVRLPSLAIVDLFMLFSTKSGASPAMKS